MMKIQRTHFNCSFALLSVALIVLVGCSGQRPVVYPNAHLQEVAEEQAEKDMVACEELADEFVSESNAGENVAGRTVMGNRIRAFGGDPESFHRRMEPVPALKDREAREKKKSWANLLERSTGYYMTVFGHSKALSCAM